MHISRTAVAIALLLVPTGAVVGADMTEESQAVEHHTSFVEIVVDEDEPREPGYAAVAGIVRCEATNAFDNAVLWFNDQVLFRKGKQGPNSACLAESNVSHVWLTEEDAPDPRENPSLTATGTVFEFTDPNQREWRVTEYKYHVLVAERSETTSVTVGDVSTSVEADAGARQVAFHTWVVELDETTVDPTIERPYNFVNVVDFEKLTLEMPGTERHDGTEDPEDGDSHNASDPDEEHALPHEHSTADVKVWLGPEPDPGPGGEEANAEVRVVTPDQVDGVEGSRGPLSVE